MAARPVQLVAGGDGLVRREAEPALAALLGGPRSQAAVRACRRPPRQQVLLQRVHAEGVGTSYSDSAPSGPSVRTKACRPPRAGRSWSRRGARWRRKSPSTVLVLPPAWPGRGPSRARPRTRARGTPHRRAADLHRARGLIRPAHRPSAGRGRAPATSTGQRPSLRQPARAQPESRGVSNRGGGTARSCARCVMAPSTPPASHASC